MPAHIMVPFQKPKSEEEQTGEGSVWVNSQNYPVRHTMGWKERMGESSWEVRAFAEDAASCSEQWPPRSYTCSFCAREFRTAQALGGHMNVHRRERAYANQLGLLRNSSSSAHQSDASCTTALTSTKPGLGLCWLYPVPAVHSHNQQVSSTIVTTATAASSTENSKDQCTGPVIIDRKKMMQDIDPNVDLELRLGQAS